MYLRHQYVSCPNHNHAVAVAVIATFVIVMFSLSNPDRVNKHSPQLCGTPITQCPLLCVRCSRLFFVAKFPYRSLERVDQPSLTPFINLLIIPFINLSLYTVDQPLSLFTVYQPLVIPFISLSLYRLSTSSFYRQSTSPCYREATSPCAVNQPHTDTVSQLPRYAVHHPSLIPSIDLNPSPVVWGCAGSAWFAQVSPAGVRQAEMDQHDVSTNAALHILSAYVQVVPSPPRGMFLWMTQHAVSYNMQPVFEVAVGLTMLVLVEGAFSQGVKPT